MEFIHSPKGLVITFKFICLKFSNCFKLTFFSNKKATVSNFVIFKCLKMSKTMFCVIHLKFIFKTWSSKELFQEMQGLKNFYFIMWKRFVEEIQILWESGHHLMCILFPCEAKLNKNAFIRTLMFFSTCQSCHVTPPWPGRWKQRLFSVTNKMF